MDMLQPIRDPLKLFSYPGAPLADVIIFKTDSGVVVVDGKSREVILATKDHLYAFQTAVDYVLDMRGGKIVIGPGAYGSIYGAGDVVVKKDAPLVIEGWYPRPFFRGGTSSATFLDDIRFVRSGFTSWGYEPFLFLRNLTIRHRKRPAIWKDGDYGWLVYLDNVSFTNISPGDSPQATITFMGFGPPGLPVTWKRVGFYWKPSSSLTAHTPFFADIHYEFIEINGLHLNFDYDSIYDPSNYQERGIRLWCVFGQTVRNAYSWFAFTQKTGGVIVFDIYANNVFKFDGIYGNIISTGYVYPTNVFWFYVASATPGAPHIILRNINIVKAGYTTRLITDVKANYSLRENAELTIEGIVPKSGIIFNPANPLNGTTTLSGDGVTTDFKIADNPVPNVDDLFAKHLKVHVKPISPDAIASLPMLGYLSDDDGDGVYESIHVKFATAPPSGTDNVIVRWKIRYI